LGGELGATAGSVTVDGNPCAISSWTDTSVSCSTPGGSGSDVPVILTTAGGQAANTVFFTYEQPAPAIASLSPTTGPEAGGTVLTLAGSDFGATAGIVTVDGAACPVLTWNDGEITCTLPAGTGADVPVLAVNEAGASSNTALFSYVAAPPPAVPGLGAVGMLLLIAMLGAAGVRSVGSSARSA
jgi:hypothetical protein